MKNLVNCSPTEFLRQTSKIKKSVEKWLKLTDIMSIRTKKPEGLLPYIKSADAEEQKKIVEHNRELLQRQAHENVMEILDQLLEKYPTETAELLALVCFVEPEDMDNHKMSEYLASLAEMMNDESVIDFFTSLTRWEQRSTVKR